MEENNPDVRGLLLKDREMLTSMQAEMSTARQFVMVKRCRGMKPEQVFVAMNRVLKSVAEQGFEVQRMSKEKIGKGGVIVKCFWNSSFKTTRVFMAQQVSP